MRRPEVEQTEAFQRRVDATALSTRDKVLVGSAFILAHAACAAAALAKEGGDAETRAAVAQSLLRGVKTFYRAQLDAGILREVPPWAR